MSPVMWNARNELLTECHSAIERRTQGRLSHLSLNIVDGLLVIVAHSETYYAVQLALAAVLALSAEHPQLTLAQMSCRVNGHPLVLGNLNAVGTRHLASGSDSIPTDQYDTEHNTAPLRSLSATAVT